ncbi:MAG: class I SAM-dependent methyltransferase [Caldilineaceae bacterium]|nr:class I SAM-dependent methyltransferase [Caldilineaceae bacterium]
MNSGTQPYYATGQYLQAKHAQIDYASGRTIERWTLQLLPNGPSTRVLDAGCGWGRFSWPLLEAWQLPSTNLVCADRSLGMLESAAQEAQRRGYQPHFVNCGIEALPFPTRHFGGVMANFVLYHVEPLAQGVHELARVLKSDGWLLVAAHGVIEVLVLQLHFQALDQLGIPYDRKEGNPFNLDNGTAVLESSFGQIERHEFIDEQRYPSAEAFTQNYMTIGGYRSLLARPDVSEEAKAALPHRFCELAKQVADPQGVIHVPISMGAFVCTNPR